MIRGLHYRFITIFSTYQAIADAINYIHIWLEIYFKCIFNYLKKRSTLASPMIGFKVSSSKPIPKRFSDSKMFKYVSFANYTNIVILIKTSGI